MLPVPEDESEWRNRYVMFATNSGSVRRNALEDFSYVPSNGKIAMKLEGDERIVGVRICGDQDDVLLAARSGKCIRFPVIDVRVFKSRGSLGVRGIRLIKNDQVISMTVLAHSNLAVDARDAYLRWSNARRRSNGDDDIAKPPQADELAEIEEFLLTVTENGYGKRTSAYEYRTSGRGGQGIINIETSKRNGNVVATGPVKPGDELVLVTDKGKLIRCPIDDIRIAGRNTQGVTLFQTEDDEHVVSVARLRDDSGESEDDE